MCPEIPKDDLRRPTNDVFVLFSVCGVTLSKDRFRYAISLKREDFKDVRQNATRNVMVLKSCFCIKILSILLCHGFSENEH